mmetsp:Transcript_54974/g.96201  ORF Transcript_54974/g.96201 Transcript_54974/m.96201 type:complete len:278 (-) Transcript_54974:2116-2949(-)
MGTVHCALLPSLQPVQQLHAALQALSARLVCIVRQNRQRVCHPHRSIQSVKSITILTLFLLFPFLAFIFLIIAALVLRLPLTLIVRFLCFCVAIRHTHLHILGVHWKWITVDIKRGVRITFAFIRRRVVSDLVLLRREQPGQLDLRVGLARLNDEVHQHQQQQHRQNHQHREDLVQLHVHEHDVADRRGARDLHHKVLDGWRHRQEVAHKEDDQDRGAARQSAELLAVALRHVLHVQVRLARPRRAELRDDLRLLQVGIQLRQARGHKQEIGGVEWS